MAKVGKRKSQSSEAALPGFKPGTPRSPIRRCNHWWHWHYRAMARGDRLLRLSEVTSVADYCANHGRFISSLVCLPPWRVIWQIHLCRNSRLWCIREHEHVCIDCARMRQMPYNSTRSNGNKINTQWNRLIRRLPTICTDSGLIYYWLQSS